LSEIRLSTFSILDHYPERGGSVGDRLRRGLELCELADKLDYEACWVGEHHFSNFGVMPNPAVWLTAAAQRTRRIRLGPAVSVLPFRHPLQIVEDYALVDQLSGGRLNLGLGSGTLPYEFDGFDIDVTGKRDRFEESLSVLRNEFAAGADARTNVPMVQPGGPPLYVATNRVEAAHDVGLKGDALLTLVSPDSDGPEVVRERLAAHRRGLIKSGIDAEGVDQAVAIMAHVAESDEQALQDTGPAMIRFLGSHGDLPTEKAEEVLDQALSKQSVLFGSPETFAKGIERLHDAGARHLVLWMDLGDLPQASVEKSLRLAMEASRSGRGSTVS
jgi:alkanesulfonate monooxygenase SsuD/methylene tetrahydromethanopterin reductase-like flavin-dependent oxidoreductase (luciferase family)